jgi:hypothetical protein
MGLTAVAVNQADLGEEVGTDGFFSTLGTSALMGGAATSVGLSTGVTSGKLLGRGLDNRFVHGLLGSRPSEFFDRAVPRPTDAPFGPLTKDAAKKAGGLFKSPAGKAFGKIGGIYGLGAAVEGYMGYQEGGAWGAAKGVASGLAQGAAWQVGETVMASLLGSSVVSASAGLLLAAAYFATAGYAVHSTLKYGRETSRGMRQMEMGSPVVDPHGLGYTMRQRSVMAIQKSMINGRMAMGNEALLLHNGSLY